MSVSYMTHPLIRHKITLLRKEDTSTNEFRKLVEEIAMLMGYEALSDLETQDITVKTPIEESVQPVISGKKLAVVPILRADIDMVKTVIRNLISNAIKFSNEGAEVVVSLAEEDGMAIVSVKDSGCGIDEENQRKLLHTDTHFSTFGTNNEEGSGLGLLLCKDFVIKNGGKLWFTSKKGEGSTFSFSIPLLDK